MPEVHALVAFLAERTVGHAISRATITSFSALKTFALDYVQMHKR